MTVTYLDLVIFFWQKDIEHNFTPNEVALYFFILKTANGTHWKNPFGLSNAITMAKFGIGKTSFDTAKRNLKTAGLIDFKAGDGRGNVYQYTITIDRKPVRILRKGEEKVYQKTPLSNNLSDTLSTTLSDPKPEASIDNRSSKRSRSNSVPNGTGAGSQNQQASKNSDGSQKEKSSAKKEKDEEDPPQEESSLYTRCIAIYNGFVIERTGMGAKIKPRSGKAMKDIIAYLSREARAKVKDRPQDEVEARVIQVWEGTLAKDTWDMLRPYLRNKIKLEDIEFEFVNILSEIKNGTNNQAGNTGANGTGSNGRSGQSAGTARGRGATISDIQNAKRPGASDNQERTEFTPIEVVK